jgi:hypothetical protein
MTEHYLDHLLSTIRTVSTEQGLTWLEQAISQLQSSSDLLNDLILLSAMARRQLGQTSLGVAATPVSTPVGEIAISSWALGDAGRIVLLLEAIHRQPDRSVELVSGVYRFGDELERAAVIRGLSLFPNSELLKPIALETGRVNSLTLYQALALGNPYPAAYYTDPEFNQLVLKAMFMGLPLEAVSGLPQRANLELARMCEDYLDERVAAQRPVPVDLWLALGPCASPRGEQLLSEYTRAEDSRHRYYATLALSRRLPANPGLRALLEERLDIETDERILPILRRRLAS